MPQFFRTRLTSRFSPHGASRSCLVPARYTSRIQPTSLSPSPSCGLPSTTTSPSPNTFLRRKHDPGPLTCDPRRPTSTVTHSRGFVVAGLRDMIEQPSRPDIPRPPDPIDKPPPDIKPVPPPDIPAPAGPPDIQPPSPPERGDAPVI